MEAKEGSWKAASSFTHVVGTAPHPPPLSTSKLAAPPRQRQRFSVELRPGETTIVSWKRLLKESKKAAKPSPEAPLQPCVPNAALESRVAPTADLGSLVEGDRRDALPPPNRFNAVIEKIERLYVGQHSSDEEELDNVRDEDEYDTDDSFIDDTELDEYFEVDKSVTKHNGYFVNRGKLERRNEHVSADHAPKKRRRKDSSKDQIEADGKSLPNGNMKIGDVHAKAAIKSETSTGIKLSSSTKISLSASENCKGVNSNNQLNVPPRSISKKSTDSITKSLNPSVEVRNKDIAFSSKAKHLEQQRANIIESRDLSCKLKVTSESDEGTSIQNDCSRKVSNFSNEREPSSKIGQNKKNRIHMNASVSKNPAQAGKSQSTPSTGSSQHKLKGTMLEQAIQELEKTVAESRPPTSEFQEVDSSSQGVKRRLPLDVKQKLAKVARLAQSSHGRIPEELINRLMGIVGHVVQLKTLKRNLKKMVELGLSAIQEKENGFQQLKKEIAEMIKIQSCSKSREASKQGGSSDDFQDMPLSSDGAEKYSMDDVVENKLCDLYDLYVEGMEEDKTQEIRKLYVELAALWPSGAMDKHGIRKAIKRAKQRKWMPDSQLQEEKSRKKQISAEVKTNDTRQGEGSGNPQPPSCQEMMVNGDCSKESTFSKKPVSRPPSSSVTNNLDLPTSSKMLNPSLNLSNLDRPSQEKVRTSVNMVDKGGTPEPNDIAVMKKKFKRKSEPDLGEGHSGLLELPSPSHHGEKRYKSHKIAVSRPQKSSQPAAAIHQGCEQPS